MNNVTYITSMRSLTFLLPIVYLLGLSAVSSFANGEVTGTKSHEDEICLLQENTIIKSRKQPLDVQVAASNRVCLSCPTALDFDKHRVLDWIAYHNLHGIDCFLLFLDTEKSDFSNPLTLNVYKKLTSSPMVTIINGTMDTGGTSTRIGESMTLSEAASILPKDVAYLGLIDTDEYLVADRLHEASTNSRAIYEIPQMLENRIGSQSVMGVYLNRWTYGSNGWTDPPPYGTAPEFVYFVERGSLPHKLGKMIINFELAVKHDVHFGEKQIQHHLPLKADEPQMVSASDTFLSINHYMVASLQECRLKARVAANKYDRAKECEKGLYSEVKDELLVKWADPTRKRRAILFP